MIICVFALGQGHVVSVSIHPQCCMFRGNGCEISPEVVFCETDVAVFADGQLGTYAQMIRSVMHVIIMLSVPTVRDPLPTEDCVMCVCMTRIVMLCLSEDSVIC